jgi:serine O-acetyltransferase
MIKKDNLIQERFACLNCTASCLETKGESHSCEECLATATIKLTPEQEKLIIEEMGNILNNFFSDVNSVFKKDPAAKSIVEVFSAYPGVHAVLFHRIAHIFYQIGVPFIPRFLSYLAQRDTGIDIHPGATIGKNFFIDHGTGVVIGETTEIGDNVTIYQGVSLGGVSLDQKKRHPTLGNNIVVGAGAKVLGPINIGDNTRIGANSVVTKDIPPNSVVVGVPGRIVKSDNIEQQILTLAHDQLPDPIMKYIKQIEQRIAKLEQESRNVEESEYGFL